MTVSKVIVGITSLVFIGYGVGFVLAPSFLSQLVTGSVPSSTSGMIDMRATYGGMSIAVGVLLLVLSRSALRLGLSGVVITMLCMAGARTYGIFVDGEANTSMYVYLALEVVVAIIAGVLLRKPVSDKH